MRRRDLLALKIAAGNTICCLFVFLPELAYPSSSLAAIMYLISTGMVADTIHVGANIAAAIITFTSGMLGAVIAAIVLLISPNTATLLCLLCLIILPATLSLRFGPHPKYLFHFFVTCSHVIGAPCLLPSRPSLRASTSSASIPLDTRRLLKVSTTRPFPPPLRPGLPW